MFLLGGFKHHGRSLDDGNHASNLFFNGCLRGTHNPCKHLVGPFHGPPISRFFFPMAVLPEAVAIASVAKDVTRQLKD